MDRQARLAALPARLAAWYRRRRRDLPWRRTRDPYAVWVAEVMLQQTRVATVIPYYERFLAAFPDVRALAEAPLERVLKVWEGLGYYARARNLHRAARRLLREHDGRLPADAAALRRLPGIGPYTAGAIASIAFGRDEPVLDGNVARVLCRLFRLRGDPRAARTRDRLWRLAGRIVRNGRAGLVNQALMDLGATVCTPCEPQCRACPVAPLCAAREHGEQRLLPRRGPRRPVPHHEAAVGVILRGRRLLIGRRPADGLLGGLWEFPGGKRRRGETLEACLRREVREEVGIEVRIERPLVTVRHAYSHFRVTLHAFVCRHVRGRTRALACAEVRWVPPEHLDRFAFPAANRRILAALREEAAAH